MDWLSQRISEAKFRCRPFRKKKFREKWVGIVLVILTFYIFGFMFLAIRENMSYIEARYKQAQAYNNQVKYYYNYRMPIGQYARLKK